jgi:ornithine cyclodeaminase
MNNSITLLTYSDVASLLEGQEDQIIDLVREVYLMHAAGCAEAPPQAALRFSNRPTSRILAKAAYLPGRVNAAGLKWVASFPENTARGIERSSAIMVLNSIETGRPDAIVEASQVNFKRTAASAALAASVLAKGEYERAGFIGCGSVNRETVRFLLKTTPSLRAIDLFDSDLARAEVFAAKCRSEWPELETAVRRSSPQVLAECPLVSFATSATAPYIGALDSGYAVEVILHISLRDFSPEVIMGSDNVVDDADHVCTSSTSLHLAENHAGNRDFIRCAIGELLTGSGPTKKDRGQVTIFSPFGLATLDLAVCHFLRQRALDTGVGVCVDSFLN